MSEKHGEAPMDQQLAERARLAARAELRTRLSSVSTPAARQLAEEIAEAAYGSPAVHRQLLEKLQALGLVFPAGTVP